MAAAYAHRPPHRKPSPITTEWTCVVGILKEIRSISQFGLAKLGNICFVLPPDIAPDSPPTMKAELVEKASEIVTDPLVLVNLVSQRVRQLNSGRSPLIPTRPSMGAADIALTEIIEGKIRLVPQVAL